MISENVTVKINYLKNGGSFEPPPPSRTPTEDGPAQYPPFFHLKQENLGVSLYLKHI